MAYDEALAARIRNLLDGTDGLVEKKMFGGLAFLVNGHMACGIVGDDLMVRVGAEAHEAALKKRGARPMDFTGRPMKGMVYVDSNALRRSTSLEAWVKEGLTFARSLPPKR